MLDEPILMRLARLVTRTRAGDVNLHTQAPGGLTALPNLSGAPQPEQDPANAEDYRSTAPLSHNAGDPLRRKGDF